MVCKHCGYVLTPFDLKCSRCKRDPLVESESMHVGRLQRPSGVPTHKVCPRCGKVQPLNMTACDNCGREFHTDFSTQSLAFPEPQLTQVFPPQPSNLPLVKHPTNNARQPNYKWVPWVVGFSFLCLISVLFPSAFSKPDKDDAYIYSRDQVQASLSDPDGASFPSWWDTDSAVQDDGNGIYECHDYVDAQNAFGGKVRDNWETRVKYLGDKNWETEYMKVGDYVLIDNSTPSSDGSSEIPASLG